ncbi:PepSY domain-containing protein [Frigoribacterium sp. CFBP 8754]|uniref:PepSY domain-containing protein n=1 Tax=Frigoribacterium sp. CFBP 8754 TaxID=2775290 RepID=UPI00177E4623|nr:PepSY domain-containing protein [Frigoribacterium sp. CFBP 8754]MBD8660939.1 PepSY domain-containing protein [Frigoribacterium sp. CFBP 8754]
MKNTKKTLLIAGGVAAVLVLGGGGVALATGLDDDRLSAQTTDRAREAALAETGGGTVTEVDTIGDGLPGYEVEVALPGGGETHVYLDDDYAVTSTRTGDDRGGDRGDRGGRDDDDRDGASGSATDDSAGGSGDATTGTGTGTDDDTVTGADYDQASAAALSAAGGGTVTDVDRSDDGGVAYEVDVRLDDGTEVDVDLDAAFGVVRTDVDAPRS